MLETRLHFRVFLILHRFFAVADREVIATKRKSHRIAWLIYSATLERVDGGLGDVVKKRGRFHLVVPRAHRHVQFVKDAHCVANVRKGAHRLHRFVLHWQDPERRLSRIIRIAHSTVTGLALPDNHI